MEGRVNGGFIIYVKEGGLWLFCYLCNLGKNLPIVIAYDKMNT